MENSKPEQQDAQPQQLQGPQNSGNSNKALWWILGSVGVLLLVGGIVTALLFGKFVGETATRTQEIFEETGENLSDLGDDISGVELEAPDEISYVLGVAPIFVSIEEALDLWSEAADLGADEDFEGSTAKLEEALVKLDEAEKAYQNLTPPDSMEDVHDEIGEALANGRDAMESGIQGNNEDDESSIAASGEAIERLIENLGNIDDALTEATDAVEEATEEL